MIIILNGKFKSLLYTVTLIIKFIKFLCNKPNKIIYCSILVDIKSHKKILSYRHYRSLACYSQTTHGIHKQRMLFTINVYSVNQTC